MSRTKPEAGIVRNALIPSGSIHLESELTIPALASTEVRHNRQEVDYE